MSLSRKARLQTSTPLAPMSARKRAALAAAGVANPLSTLATGAPRKPMMRTAAPVKRARYTGPDRATVDLLAVRSGGWCEFPGCRRRAQDPHHRDERGAGGRGAKAPAWINSLANLLAACRPHNDWASNGSPEVARAFGWLVPMGLATPYTVPVLTRHHPDKVLLNDDGGWSPVREVAA